MRVNIVTKSLFRKYPDPQSFARAPQAEMERDVKQTGFFRNKAKAVIAASKAIIEKHDGEVPQTMEELTALPGVGRKTANVVLGNAFKKNIGIVVDTHVARVSGRLGLTANSDPVEDIHYLIVLSRLRGQRPAEQTQATASALRNLDAKITILLSECAS